MIKEDALQAAIGLSHNPTLAVHLRGVGLPGGILPLLQIMGGSQEALDSAVALHQTTPDRIVRAVRFYLEQVMMHARADDYRLLGGTPGTELDELREHRRWILRWLHPDRSETEWEQEQFVRVCDAWGRIVRHEAVLPPPPEFLGRNRSSGSRHAVSRDVEGLVVPSRWASGGRRRRRHRGLRITIGAALLAATVATTLVLDRMLNDVGCPPSWAAYVPMCYRAEPQ